MKYPKVADIAKLTQELELYAQLKTEYGAKGVSDVVADAGRALRESLAELKKLSNDRELASREPSDLEKIRELLPAEPPRVLHAERHERGAGGR